MNHSDCLLAVGKATPDSTQPLASPFFIHPRLDFGMAMSNAETLAQNYAPGLVALFRSLVSTARQSQHERERVEQLEQRRDAQTEETAASPTPHVDEFCALNKSGETIKMNEDQGALEMVEGMSLQRLVKARMIRSLYSFVKTVF